LLRSSPHDGRRRGRRAVALALAIGLIAEPGRAVCAYAQAASPFPEVVIEKPPRHTYRLAYASVVAGAALIGGSFVLTRRADDAYVSYLRETDPGRIESLYDRAVLYDRLASGSLLTGEALLVAGVYLRFLRSPRESRVQFALEPGRCALSLRF
jgi:hypothetical protein